MQTMPVLLISAALQTELLCAMRYYFPIIMLASEDTIQDPDTIEPGMVLTIPDLNKNLKEKSVHSNLKSFFTEIADVYKNKRTASASTIRRELLNIAQSF